MANWLTTRTHSRFNVVSKTTLSAASAALLSIGLWAAPSLAKDPFRTTNTRPISTPTENAFNALFQQGDYQAAAKYVAQDTSNDPLSQALRASLAYINWDSAKKDAQNKVDLLEQFRTYAQKTQDAAQSLIATDPLRGNLYLAVGHFFDGAYAFSKDGTVKGTPVALSEIQQAFKYLDAAAAKGPDDPELNLIKGYIDLFVSLNLPFSSPSDAISRLEQYARPRYLAYRGVALGYRDLNQPAKALSAVTTALQESPDNPDLLYLKAQILASQGNNRDSIVYFDKALRKQDRLPPSLVKQITRERSRAQRRLENVQK